MSISTVSANAALAMNHGMMIVPRRAPGVGYWGRISTGV